MEAEKTAPEIAREAVDLIGRLFAVEKQAKDMSLAERLALRQTQSVPVLAELRRKLLAWKEQLLPKHPIAEAVNYTLGQWEELRVFTGDGAVPIDNNASNTASGIGCIVVDLDATVVTEAHQCFPSSQCIANRDGGVRFSGKLPQGLLEPLF